MVIGVLIQMNYYINEHSLRGQFEKADDFWNSVRKYTLPALKRIESNQENVIWKKDSLWQAAVCGADTLLELLNANDRKNERSSITAALKIKLLKLVNQQPYWSIDGGSEVEICEYGFDSPYSKTFPAVNCFTEAIANEGRILSFMHESYKRDILEFLVVINGKEENLCLDNIYSEEWWKKEPLIKTWRLEEGYLIEIRSNEYTYHPTHFHVSHNEFEAVFRLEDGQLYRRGKRNPSPRFFQVIREWYEENVELMRNAWKEFHEGDMHENT